MKLNQLILLIATVTVQLVGADDSWKYNLCNSVDICYDNWPCCTATKKKDGSDAPSGTLLCTLPGSTGPVPDSSTSPYRGFKYSCSDA